MVEIESETRTSTRQQLAKDSGYTGLSIFHTLHVLYGFDFLHDSLFDVMHNFPLNVIKRHLEWLVANNMVDGAEVDKRLQDIKWSSGKIPFHYFYCS